jgi:catechol 2,3-dioxygenase-like lactoylglutathione lyase family enzyme
MMTIDHVAVPSKDIAASVNWYVSRLGASILYRDATWAFLKMGNTKIAIVRPEQHPPHVAVSVTESELEKWATEAGMKIDLHRDGTKGIYISDPGGNAIELICYPPGQTAYAKKPAST